MNELSATESENEGEVILVSELTCCLVRTILPEPQAQLEVIETASHLPF